MVLTGVNHKSRHVSRISKLCRDLTQSEIDGMNSIKALEADAGELFKQIGQIEGVDPRLLALAKTNLQQGFMWFVRSIAKPADPFS